MDIPESENYYLYNTIIIISILIAILAAVNFAVLYRYILSRRTKTLAVFRMRALNTALRMFLSECMFITVPLFALTTIIYDKFMLPKLGQHFEYIESAYSFNVSAHLRHIHCNNFCRTYGHDKQISRKNHP